MTDPLVYIECALDRASARRADADWLAARRVDPDSRLVPIWRDRNLIAEHNEPRGIALRGEAAIKLHAGAAAVVFLGLDSDGHAWFAADLPAAEQPPAITFAEGGSFVDLGRFATIVRGSDGGVLAYARAMMHWHRHHRFCGCCGAATISADGGHSRICTAVGCGVRSFPRTDPVVIMLVTRPGPAEAACLLARQPSWPRGLMSTLAGFVEPGETLETAVRREVGEEAGIDAIRVCYRASQPWPFPQSLMLGFQAEAAEGAVIDAASRELEDARWFTRSEVARIRDLGLRLPFRGTIARWLIDQWQAEGE